MENNVKYPIGDQSFESIRKGGALYVDKSAYIESLLRNSKYYFLGRPRRFGKSLFLSMLKCFFEGKRDLFRGLSAETMDWDWQPHPVLHLDLNVEQYKSPDTLKDVLDYHLNKWESLYGEPSRSENLALRFKDVIEAAYRKTGRGVVILVDEYDKPLVNNVNDKELFSEYKATLAAFYSNFKSSADYIKMLFLTGVSRFGKLTVFSGLNNIWDLSLMDEYSAICGITEDELRSYFKPGIAAFAQKLGVSGEELLEKLKQYYDGYHFSSSMVDIYNPFSILKSMAEKEFNNYWIESGTPTLLVEQLKNCDTSLETFMNVACSRSDLIGIEFDSRYPIALFYQTGYLTIKEYDPEFMLYTLGAPNKEVRDGFFKFILPYYTGLNGPQSVFAAAQFVREMRKGDAEAFMRRMQDFFASIPYEMGMENERNVQNVMYAMMTIVGLNAKAETRTSNGRIDITVDTPGYAYIIELKFGRSAREALDQINRKKYQRAFAHSGKRVIKIGANFSPQERTIDEWIIEQE